MPPANRHDPVRAESSDSDYSVTEFLRDFPDDAACLEHLWRSRYSRDGEHAHCPKCDRERRFKRYATKQGRQSWTCTGCGHHVHPTAGTIFAKSSTSLRLWFHCLYPMTSTRCGISATHTNTIEGFFGNLKTGMRGAYKRVSPRWLQSYLDEYAWRYNQRNGGRAMFKTLLDRATA